MATQATQFYREKNQTTGTNDFFNAQTGQYISATQFGQGAGFKENTKPVNIKSVLPEAPKPTPTPPTQGNVMSADTVQNGMTYGDVGSNLPSKTLTQQAANLYTNTALNDATKNYGDLQNELNTIKVNQLKNVEAQRIKAESDLTNLENQKQTEITNYDTAKQPLVEQANKIYGNMLGGIENVDYSKLVQDKLSLTNDIINYSKMMNDEVAKESAAPTLAIVQANRVASIKDTYQAKISTAQAATQAIDGNFTLAFDIMDKGANAINQTTSDRINFLNMASSLFDNKITYARAELSTAKSDEKTAIDNTIKYYENKIATVDENKKKIQDLMSNPETAIVAQKANILLTDTPEVFAQKLNDFYVKNPQYNPANISANKDLMTKYPDAGISVYDTLEQAQDKVSKSKFYQGSTENTGKYTLTTDSNGNQIVIDQNTGEIKNVSDMTDLNNGIVGGYDISSYATDPNHEKAVASILNGIGKFNTVQDIDNYIKTKYPKSSITGQMVANASEKYGVSWEMLVAMMAQDSSLGTAGKGAKTYNPGNVGNDDSGNIRNYGNWQSGVDAVAEWLGRHKVAEGENNSSSVVSSWANRINAGKATIANVPKELKNTVVLALDKENGGKTSDAISLKEQALISAEQLLEKLNKGEGTSAIGASRLLQLQRIPGSASKNIEILFNNLKSSLSLDNVKFLKGQGAVSDAERALLASASAKIDLNQSEPEFKKFLNEIIKNLKGENQQDTDEYPAGTIVEVNGIQYRSLGNGQFEPI